MSETPDRDQQTEAPTPKKRDDAAKQGDVLISRELASALVMLAGIGWLALTGQWLVASAGEVLRRGLVVDRDQLSLFDPAQLILALLDPLLLPLGGLLLASILAAVVGPALLGSLGWRSKAMALKPSRLSPLAGIKRMFGTHGLIELVKALAKAAILGATGWWVIQAQLDRMIALGTSDVKSAANLLGDGLMSLLLALLVGMVLIALVDVPAQMFERTRRLRMTREQVKEELRQSEGSPELKSALRARQQAILAQSARKGMAEANVVLNNPSHFSVALRYRPGTDIAPLVVARGRDEVARAIRLMADERAIPMLDYPQLTRALYFSTRAGQHIPEDLYQAIAIIYAFVFRLDRELGLRQSPPIVEVPSAKRFDADGNVEAG